MAYISRRSKRLLPKNAVTVALLDDDYPVGYGVVKDISETGACIITDSALSRDRGLLFKMSFYREGMLAAAGRVVWSEAVKGQAEGARHGIEFTSLSESERRLLRRILDSSTFGTAAE
jgi:hypothetical protein